MKIKNYNIIYCDSNVGIIGSTATRITMVFKNFNSNFTGNSPSIPSSITVNLSKVKATNTNTNPEAWSSLLFTLFGGVKVEWKIPLINNSFRVYAEQTSDVIKQLDLMNPNWRDSFINSPLELGDNSLVSFLFTSLSNSLYLHYICLYLIFMLIVIYTCKYIIDRNINLEPIKIIYLGKYLYLGLTKYLSSPSGLGVIL